MLVERSTVAKGESLAFMAQLRASRASEARPRGYRVQLASASGIVLVAGITLFFGCSGGVWHSVRSALEAERLDQALVAYDRAQALDGGDPEVVAALARLLLKQSVQSGDRRMADAAVTQLALASSRGRPVLEELLGTMERGWARVRVLSALASGEKDPHVRAKLTAQLRPWLASDDPSVVRIALRYATEEDRPWLERALNSSDVTVIAAALRRLRQLGTSVWALNAARRAVAHSDSRVRSAAVALLVVTEEDRRSLFPVFSDPDQLVVLALLQALSVQSDLATDEETLRALAAQLVWPPSPVSIAAAHVLAKEDPLEAQSHALSLQAVEYLQRVIAREERMSLRSQAAVALITVEPSLPLRHFVVEALARIGTEARDLRMQLSRVLLMDPPAERAAIAELQRLLDRCDVPGVEAAQLLAEREEGAVTDLAVEHLARCIDPTRVPDHTARRLAARSLSISAGKVLIARSCLSDPEPLVRIFCAGGIVAHVEPD